MFLSYLSRFGVIGRTPCVVHTLQLVVNMIDKEASAKWLLDKVRVLFKLFRKSSVATEWLLQLCQLTLVKDCPTKWSSTYLMITRLLQVKDSVVQVADGMSWDHLLPSEWQRLTALRDLLLPFAEHTQILQSDTQSLSLVIPALLDLRGHLSDFPHAQGSSFKDLTSLEKKMNANMEQPSFHPSLLLHAYLTWQWPLKHSLKTIMNKFRSFKAKQKITLLSSYHE